MCREQYQAEVLGVLRHQQQVARVPGKDTGEWQRKLEQEIRRIAAMGEPPSAEYLRAPRPWGLGFSEIELEGAVDFIMGMGQLRWAATETKAAILGEMRQQLMTHGLCTRVTLPQIGPWAEGSHTIIRDLMRSIGQLGVAVVGEEAGFCQHKGPHIVRASGKTGKRQVGHGVVLEHVYGKDTWLEKWEIGRTELFAVTGPGRVVQWLAKRGIHHIPQLAKYVITRERNTDGERPPKRRKTQRDRGPGTEDEGRRRYIQTLEEWHAARAEKGEWQWLDREERIPADLREEYVAWIRELTDDGTERRVHRTLREEDKWNSRYEAMGGDTKSKYPQVEKVMLGGGHEEPALRRIYPHFVRSREKRKHISVGGLGNVQLAARRVAWIESRDFVTRVGIKKWWERQGGIQRGIRECWGLSPEVEFILLHGLGVTEQRLASPYTALKGAGGKALTYTTYELLFLA